MVKDAEKLKGRIVSLRITLSACMKNPSKVFPNIVLFN